MQYLTEQVMMSEAPDGLFNRTVINNLFPEYTEAAKRGLIHRALQTKEITRLKPGVYCLEQKFRRSDPHPFVLAGLLHSPYYISLESALWFHQLIPEALYNVSCMTIQRNRIYKNKFGIFSYYSIKCKDFKAGVSLLKLNKDYWIFIASPLRAIADLIYLNKKIAWEKDGIRYLTDSLRIEPDTLHKLSFKYYKEIYSSIGNERVRQYLFCLRGALKK